MNQRIQELMDQCEEKYSTQNYPCWDMEKFARLIAKECAEICKKQEYDYWRSSEDQDFTPQDCADAIEQHFGVSE